MHLRFSLQATDNTDKKDSKIERIYVTGSSIKRTRLEGDLRLSIISRANIEATVIAPAEQLLLQLER